MTNKDSDFYRAHPDWILATPERSQSHGRYQHVLDFSRKEVVDAIYEHLQPLHRVTVIADPTLGRIVEHSRIEPPAAAGTGLKEHLRRRERGSEGTDRLYEKIQAGAAVRYVLSAEKSFRGERDGMDGGERGATDTCVPMLLTG